MTQLIITPEFIVRRLQMAAGTGLYTGLIRTPADQAYLKLCLFDWTEDDKDRATRFIFTRDVGHHMSGWFKNPEYERCYHLSLSFWKPMGYLTPPVMLPQNHTAALEWCKRFYGDDHRKIWIEPPYTPEGKENDTYHYRLFCDEHWQPIQPRGEVYTKTFTERGWKSFSELHPDANAEFGMGDPS